MPPSGFCAWFALLKTGLSNRNLNKKGLKIESFLKKKILICFFFLDPRPKSQILTPHPCPPRFEQKFSIDFSIDTLIFQ